MDQANIVNAKDRKTKLIQPWLMHWIEFKEPSFRKTLARFIKTSIYTAVEGFKSKDQPSYVSKLERYFKDYFKLWEHDMEIYGKKKR